MAHVSLYRRYRPGRFEALRGQEHIVKALTNAVATDSASHAYLFSGPRGTGKTSTARILAKALNCTDLHDGEPCGVCESCRAIEAGSSYDLFELDAASNNGVDAMRELISRTAVGSPGRTKVYILDEVHMLSPAASNALLKTVEEPPEHVTFVLATTDPQKVLPTIRSRTQHFEFRLLTAVELDDYVRWIITDAGLALDDSSIAQVVRQGRGSARDTLSALDLAVAAGGLADRGEPIDGVLAAMAERDVGAAILAVADAMAQGREPRVLAEALLATLRDAMLLSVGADTALLSDLDRERLGDLARRLGTPTITRGLESLGAAIVDMRQASDPRVPLEVALIRLCDPALDTSMASLVERIEKLERLGRNAPSSSAPPPPPLPAVDVASPDPSAPLAPSAPSAGTRPARGGEPRPAADARNELARAPRPAPPIPPARGGASRATATPASVPASAPPTPVSTSPSEPAPSRDAASTAPAAAQVPESGPATPAPTPAAAGELPSRDELESAMSGQVLASLRGIAKAIYSGGRFVDVDDGVAVFALNNAATRDRAERVRVDVEQALASHFGRPVPLRLIDEQAAPTGRTTSTAPSGDVAAPSVAPANETPPAEAAKADDDPDEDETIELSDVADLEDAPSQVSGGVDRLVQAFPGAVVVEPEDS